jgi:DNA-binding NarL/FixJ family response regulator
MAAIKTIIADKQTMFIEGIMSIMNTQKPQLIDIVEIVESGRGLIDYLETGIVECVIMDLNLVDLDGLEVIPQIRSKYKDIKICVLTDYGDYKFVKEALMKGADGYILKSNSVDDLENCIINIFNDKTYIAPGLHITPPRMAVNIESTKSIYEDRFMIRRKLTNREQEILSLIAQAKNNREIAEELYISDQTVGVHRKNIMRKLGVRNTVNLIKFALENQLV